MVGFAIAVVTMANVIVAALDGLMATIEEDDDDDN
jgi:hypothetical protein